MCSLLDLELLTSSLSQHRIFQLCLEPCSEGSMLVHSVISSSRKPKPLIFFLKVNVFTTEPQNFRKKSRKPSSFNFFQIQLQNIIATQKQGLFLSGHMCLCETPCVFQSQAQMSRLSKIFQNNPQSAQVLVDQLYSVQIYRSRAPCVLQCQLQSSVTIRPQETSS